MLIHAASGTTQLLAAKVVRLQIKGRRSVPRGSEQPKCWAFFSDTPPALLSGCRDRNRERRREFAARSLIFILAMIGIASQPGACDSRSLPASAAGSRGAYAIASPWFD
jgi:hypothetical protein